jgi:hypothetical protein
MTLRMNWIMKPMPTEQPLVVVIHSPELSPPLSGLKGKIIKPNHPGFSILDINI